MTSRKQCPDSVSVVVRRMYYWDLYRRNHNAQRGVSVVVRRMYYWDRTAGTRWGISELVSVVVRRMYYWDPALYWVNFLGQNSFSSCQKNVLLGLLVANQNNEELRFQQLLEECTIGTDSVPGRVPHNIVSVVVRRMYYWDFKRNRLKTKDFDRLNSELFFENARSARKVALFSKNWGYCLTIQNISGNI